MDDTALALGYAGDMDRDDLRDSLADRLDRVRAVKTLYIGWADGRFLAVTRLEDGYRTQWIASDSGEETTAIRDEAMALVEESTVASDYDPRTRPWFTTAKDAGGPVWSEPYLDYGHATTLVSPAAPVIVDGDLVAVVAADLDLPGLRALLDDLPYGDGAEAFVLSASGEVIAAPADYTATLEAAAAESGSVPTVDDLDLAGVPATLARGESQSSAVDDRLLLDRSLPVTESVDWRVHLTAETSQLSVGLGRVGAALWWVSGLSLVVSLTAAVLAWRVSRSMGTMRVKASTDQLTGLANRHEYQRAGRRMLSQASVRGERVLAVVLDLDDFKAINDLWGHDVGDAALTATGEAIKACVRSDDIAARLGGDEFVVLQRLGRDEDPYAIVERLRVSVQDQLTWLSVHDTPVGVTAGYALSAPGMELRQLVALADTALVSGKRNAKGMVHRG